MDALGEQVDLSDDESGDDDVDEDVSCLASGSASLPRDCQLTACSIGDRSQFGSDLRSETLGRAP